jgi:hypothetical protein
MRIKKAPSHCPTAGLKVRVVGRPAGRRGTGDTRRIARIINSVPSGYVPRCCLNPPGSEPGKAVLDCASRSPDRSARSIPASLGRRASASTNDFQLSVRHGCNKTTTGRHYIRARPVVLPQPNHEAAELAILLPDLLIGP